MKGRIVGYAVAFTLGSLISGATVFAASNNTVNAVLTHTRVVYDGSPSTVWSLKYGGHTFVPVSAMQNVIHWLSGNSRLNGMTLTVLSKGYHASTQSKKPKTHTTTSSQPQQTGWEVEITGDPGLSYQGALDLTSQSGASNMQSISGTTPDTYTITGDPGIISLNAQNMGQSGTITVEILDNGSIVQQSSSSSSFGVASVSWSNLN